MSMNVNECQWMSMNVNECPCELSTSSSSRPTASIESKDWKWVFLVTPMKRVSLSPSKLSGSGSPF